MSWDNLLYPSWADKNGDGEVDIFERAEYDYEEELIAKVSRNEPVLDEDDDDLFEDFDFLDIDNEQEEKEEEYSANLELELITEADYDGYFTANGDFHCWKIDDMFDYSDDDGFWDKLGNYHEFFIEEPDNFENDGNELDEYAEAYSDNLFLEQITEADWDGYTTANGHFHAWEIDDMFDESDDNGFWDKCGYYHEYSIALLNTNKTIQRKTTTNNASLEKMFSDVYESFPGIENYLSLAEFNKCFSKLPEKVYSKDRKLAANCWAWVVTNYCEKLLYDKDFESIKDTCFRKIPEEMFKLDNEQSNIFLQHYIFKRPELMEALFLKYPYDRNNNVPFQFLAWGIVLNDFSSFEEVYKMLINSKEWVSEPPKKEIILEKILIWRNIFAKKTSSMTFYVFFKKEIDCIEHQGKKQHLNDMLRQRINGEHIFLKPNDNQYKKIIGNFPSLRKKIIAEKTKQEEIEISIQKPEVLLKKESNSSSDNAVLKELLERKRVLESMLKEINERIADFDVPSNC